MENAGVEVPVGAHQSTDLPAGAMSDRAPGPPVRQSAIPLLVRQLLPGALLAALAILVLRPVTDPDTYWHIRAGELLSRTWQFVTPDPWGAGASLPWVRNQWLPQLGMSWLADRFGLAGVAWLVSVAAVIMVGLVWWTSRLRASMLVAAVVSAIAALGMVGGMAPRPQLATFILLPLFVEAWLRTARDWRPRWWLVPLSWLWACSHGLWFLGAGLGLLVLGGMALSSRAFRRVARLAVLPVFCLVVGALTPVGPQLLASPFQVGEVTQYINEWQPVPPSNPVLLAVLLLGAIPVINGLRSARRVPWHVILLLVFALGSALLYARAIAIAAIILAPIAAHAGKDLLPREPITRRELRLTAVLATAALVVAGFVAGVKASQPGLGPNDLGPQLAALPTGTVICNDQSVGGWLIYEHPNVRVTIDTRVEIYSRAHIEGYLGFVRADPGWERYPASQRCEYALLPTDLPVVEALTSRLHWTTVAKGKESILLRSPQ